MMNEQTEAEVEAELLAAERKAESVMEEMLDTVLDKAADNETIWEHAQYAYDASGVRLGLADMMVRVADKIAKKEKVAWLGHDHESIEEMSAISLSSPRPATGDLGGVVTHEWSLEEALKEIARATPPK
jgi:hypothetical protein